MKGHGVLFTPGTGSGYAYQMRIRIRIRTSDQDQDQYPDMPNPPLFVSEYLSISLLRWPKIHCSQAEVA